MHNFSTNRLQRSRNKSKKKGIGLKKLLITIAVFLILQYLYYGFMVKPAVQSDNIAVITVERGESIKQIAKELKKENVINSKFLFKSYLRFTGKARDIQAGVFRIPLPQNISSTTHLLSTFIPVEDKVTIPEGYKISQIDEVLTQKGVIQAGEFIDCVQNCQLEHNLLQYIPNQTTRNLEGFLYPDTYFISTVDFDPSTLIIKMMDNFESKLPQDWEQKAQALPETDLYTVINMASIIEREVLSDKDKKLVSGLLWKRYSTPGWTLGADATLLYKKDDNIITYQDLQADDPYNTRKLPGFPPTPIANPGVSSIEAALNPTASEYWFYLTTLDTGRVIYAVTNEEHNANKVKYL
jgi:UPF0755 protein